MEHCIRDMVLPKSTVLIPFLGRDFTAIKTSFSNLYPEEKYPHGITIVIPKDIESISKEIKYSDKSNFMKKTRDEQLALEADDKRKREEAIVLLKRHLLYFSFSHATQKMPKFQVLDGNKNMVEVEYIDAKSFKVDGTLCTVDENFYTNPPRNVSIALVDKSLPDRGSSKVSKKGAGFAVKQLNDEAEKFIFLTMIPWAIKNDKDEAKACVSKTLEALGNLGTVLRSVCTDDPYSSLMRIMLFPIDQNRCVFHV